MRYSAYEDIDRDEFPLVRTMGGVREATQDELDDDDFWMTEDDRLHADDEAARLDRIERIMAGDIPVPDLDLEEGPLVCSVCEGQDFEIEGDDVASGYYGYLRCISSEDCGVTWASSGTGGQLPTPCLTR